MNIEEKQAKLEELRVLASKLGEARKAIATHEQELEDQITELEGEITELKREIEYKSHFEKVVEICQLHKAIGHWEWVAGSPDRIHNLGLQLMPAAPITTNISQIQATYGMRNPLDVYAQSATRPTVWNHDQHGIALTGLTIGGSPETLARLIKEAGISPKNTPMQPEIEAKQAAIAAKKAQLEETTAAMEEELAKLIEQQKLLTN